MRRRVCLGMAVIAFAGCVHAIPLAPVQQCGMQNMVADGVGFSSGQSTGAAYGTGGWAVSGVSSYGQSVSCRRPALPAEQCEAIAGMRSGSVRAAWDPSWRNLLIGLGTVAFIVPGIVASIAFHVGRDQTIDESATVYNEQLTGCMSHVTSTAGPP